MKFVDFFIVIMSNPNQHRLQIPVFDPDKNDISAKAWVNLVDLGRQAAGKDSTGNDI